MLGKRTTNDPGRASDRDATFHHALQAHVLRLTVDFERRMAILYVPPLASVAMPRAVAFCTKLDPSIRLIQIIAGETRDPIFILRGTQWVSSQESA